MNDLRRRFLARLRFPPDPFQNEAMDALDTGHSVLVAAPTGSGKTLVATYAVRRALAAGGKVFYTTPLKALSNQKYGDLAAEHGATRVGLLTGDIAIRADAPVVVMTTEVLRNMLLASSDLTAGLHTVVLDEVHYLQDPYRGGVWEEVLILSPPDVAFVCLSATVGNADELASWLRSIRGPTSLVVERTRPVVLRHHFAIARRDRRHADPEVELIPLLDHGRAAPEGLRIDQFVHRSGRSGSPGTRSGGSRRGAPHLPYRAPRRIEVVQELDDGDLLPVIFFIFSRAACDDAVRQLVRDGLRLTDSAQRSAIRQVAELHTEGLDNDDLEVLGYSEWMEGLESGIAAHHAGLVPAFRETVETCFSAGLLRVVFATETLSLGINMPARSVVIERFTKYGGAGRATLTSGEYAQLTGRAERRGLDPEGHAVVLWSLETTFAEVARVALAPPPNLRSSFRPTYNLAVNLVQRFDRPTAIDLLRHSFAQWQATGRARRERVAGEHGEESPGPVKDGLAEHLGRRLAVLEELGYVDGWRLTDTGIQLARIYHDADLLVAEAIAGEALAGAEPSVLAGVLSSLVFERRRARKIFGSGGRRRDRTGDRPRPPGTGRRRSGTGGDRLGTGRRTEVAQRVLGLQDAAHRVRALEEIHLVPRLRHPEPGLAGAVTSWARGASFGTVLEVAAADVGDIAPGDFVRIVKQVADLADQISLVAGDGETAAAAGAAARLVLRDVVASGAPQASATSGATPP